MKSRLNLARALAAAGALQLLGVGCDPAPTTTPTVDAQVGVDTPAPEDQGAPAEDRVTPADVVTPQDRVVPTDQVTPTDQVEVDVVVKTDAPAADAGEDVVVPPTDAQIVEDVVTADASDAADAPDAADVPSVECRSSTDCAMSMNGPVCNTATNTCVRCSATEDVCPVGNYCNANQCVPGCRNDMDCSGGARCDVGSRMCVNCRDDNDCGPGSICTMNSCVPGCSMTRPCGAGQTCCTAACANTDTDANNCGACGRRCGMGESCCGGACVNPQSDAANCGACGRRCAAANGTASCAMATCGVASCNAGFGDCDRNPANGCEANLATDTANCMSCGNACTAGGGATARCQSGACSVVCPAGTANCDNMASNGCEVNTNTSAANCGACGTQCPTRANASPSCTAGACGVACNMGFGNCDGNATNGCEVNNVTDVRNCGACGRVCSFANAAATCANGTCGLGTCNTGFADCNSNASDGCERNLSNDRANCGACGRTCASNAICFAGSCREVCTAPLAVCNNACVDPQTDLSNCGGCGVSCVRQTANAAPTTCTAGACAITCTRGFGNCDGTLSNGCEVNLLTTVSRCGACGTACTLANATATCSQGACAVAACAAGFGNCDGDPANGCETNVTNTVANCGACGRVCALANAAPVCTSGACGIGTCNAGWANCDNNAANGCERSVSSDTLNCGACNRRCEVGQACSSGTCVNACPTGTSFCSGGCVNFQTDARNCGACGTVCASGTTCRAGACAAVVPANDTLQGAATLSFSAATLDVTGTTTGATNNLQNPCLAGNVGLSPDVFYRFTLSRRELVYVDTFGANWDTALYFLDSMGRPVATQTPGDVVCNDDANGVCGDVGTRSRIVTVLPAGTWFIALTGWNGATGTTNLHIEHVPAAGGTLAVIAAGMSTASGRTSGSNGFASETCGGTGPENGYWWTTCPPTMSGTVTLTAETCGTAEFDTVLHLQNGNGFTACNDNGVNTCSPTSQLSVTYANTVRLHELLVDGFLVGNAGNYSVRVNRP